MKNTPAKKTAATTALSTEVMQPWGNDAGVDPSDVLIPKVLLQQGLSKFVADGVAKMGDIILSTTGEIVGSATKPMTFIPIHTSKSWTLREKIGQKFEYRGTEPMTAENVNSPMEWQAKNQKTGQMTEWRRDRNLNFYVILPEQIEREKIAMEKAAAGELPDPNDALLPVVLTFTRTSYGTGKELVTHFAKCQKFKCPPAVSMFNLTSEKVSNDLGTFYIFSLKPAGKTDAHHILAAKAWYDIISKSNVKVHEDELETPTVDVEPVMSHEDAEF